MESIGKYYISLLLQTRESNNWFSGMPDDIIREIMRNVSPINKSNYAEGLRSGGDIGRISEMVCEQEFMRNIAAEFRFHYYETPEQLYQRSLDKRNWRYQKVSYIATLHNSMYSDTSKHITRFDSSLCGLKYVSTDPFQPIEVAACYGEQHSWKSHFYMIKGTAFCLSIDLCYDCFHKKFDEYLKYARKMIAKYYDTNRNNTWPFQTLKTLYIDNNKLSYNIIL